MIRTGCAGRPVFRGSNRGLAAGFSPATVVFVLSAALLVPVAAPEYALSLDSWISVTSDMTLDRDYSFGAFWDAGLVVNADNITIDGQGHSITSVGLGNGEVGEGWGSKGIKVSGRRNVTIRNLVIRGFVQGILAQGDNIVIEGCRFEGNQWSGVYSAGGTGLTVRNCVFADTNTSAMVLWGQDAVIANNIIAGGRTGLRGVARAGASSFFGNRLTHQSQSPMANNLRLFRFTNVRRTGNVGEAFDFSLAMSLIDGTASAGSVCSVRTVPAMPLNKNQSGNVVSGSFVPTRPGLYSLIADVTDPHGNVETRLARILVGPTAERTLKYYWNDGYVWPTHGQPCRGAKDSGTMSFAMPTVEGSVQCGGWIQVSPDELPPTPAALLTGVDFNLLFKSDPCPSLDLFLQRDVTFDGSGDLRTTIPSSFATGNLVWGTFSIGGFNWPLDYPFEWYYLSLKMTNGSYFPYVRTGNAAQPSHSVFKYIVSISPEIRAVSNRKLLLLSATADPTGATGEQIVVLGDNQAADLTLADFRRPFRESATLLSATGEATFSTGAVSGEKLYAAVPLDVRPSAAAVQVQVIEWPISGEGERKWMETAVGVPGTVSHTIGGLVAGQNYNILANGSQVFSGAADAQGKISLSYGGTFPVTITVNPAANTPPTVSITSPSNGATFTAPADITINVTAADSDGTVAKVEFYNGSTKLGEDTTSPYSCAWNGVAAGTYTLTAKATDNSGATTVSAAATITVNPANVPPTVSITSPSNGATFTAPADITINVTAADSDGTVAKV
ncbi:MAG: Ig-like domain-containing protein, partial [Planctomycetota bacterium]|nr:Ig-like domain-containing protein [Planctomycetota bacterium]